MRRRSWSAVAGLVLLALLAGCTSAAGSGGSGHPTSDVSPVVSNLQPCPAQTDRAASGPTTLPRLRFDCVNGGTLDLGKAPGVPTLVNLWGSWCAPCRDELPILQQLSQMTGGRLRVVGVISKDGRPQSESFAADAGVTFPSAFDGNGDLMTGVGINVLPYTYFLGADGAVTYTQVGPVGSLDQLRQLVADHLGVRL